MSEHINYFPKANKDGCFYGINNMVYFVRGPVMVYDKDSVEWGWNAYTWNAPPNIGNYRLLTESELKISNYLIQEL